MQTLVNISVIGRVWGGYDAPYAKTVYPKQPLTLAQAAVIRKELLDRPRCSGFDGTLDAFDFGDFMAIFDVCIEQRTSTFERTYEDGREKTREVIETDRLLDWQREDSAGAFDPEMIGEDA